MSFLQCTTEAEAIFGMLNDIDGNLQAAKERADFESGENKKLRTCVMDLTAEKKLLEVQLAGIKRRVHHSKVDSKGEKTAVECVDEAIRVQQMLARASGNSQKVNFSLAIGGRKFISYHENDGPDIRFIPPATSTGPNPNNLSPSPAPPSLATASTGSLPPLDSLESTSSHSQHNSKLEFPQIQAATVDRLVERLTYEEYTDHRFIHTFLLTYRSVLSPIELMERLLFRFCSVTPSIALPKDSPPEIVDEWRKTKQEPIRAG